MNTSIEIITGSEQLKLTYTELLKHKLYVIGYEAEPHFRLWINGRWNCWGSSFAPDSMTLKITKKDYKIIAWRIEFYSQFTYKSNQVWRYTKPSFRKIGLQRAMAKEVLMLSS